MRAVQACVLLGALVSMSGCCAFSECRYAGPLSDHFDGESFHNEQPTEERTASLLRWMKERNPGPWREWVNDPPGPPPPRRVRDGRMRVTFINHATTLIQMDGLNVLTDPIWSERTSPVSFAGPVRHRAPGIRFEDLPPVDVVVISHAHYDHLDLPTLRRLQKTFSPLFLVGLGNRALLERSGLRRVRELDWWQSVSLGSVSATFVPAQHFSNRGLCDRGGALWGGYVLRGPAGVAYFAGDTAMGPHFAEIRARFGPPRLAILPIGAYRPDFVMEAVHESPEEAVEAHRILGAGTSVAIHFGTFALADDGETEPVTRLQAALSPQDRFWVLGFGEGRDVPAGQ